MRKGTILDTYLPDICIYEKLSFGVFSFMNIVFDRYFEWYKLPDVRVISAL